ncbi:uncharacterized protein DUF3306 [Paucimonas lemoignei]|uniref:Uncharacterized protein DUF3306 n=1 Tax=Paucimonas lemoignei TaxID=29443 RepID=A0A4R3HSI3_PAULE|nr:DUF3306 domain-containing protein [Paucimonas lemoignei]TCS35972.1 uncharacterized protein DUF3306 [Paucimonas lemoignei]
MGNAGQGGKVEGEGFLRRWSRLKSGGSAEVRQPVGSDEVNDERASHEVARVKKKNESGSPARAGAGTAVTSTPGVPTLEDAMYLTQESDYSAFVAKGVDKSVRRLALKKLFTDPHFNQPDGLDIYMGDYNRAIPLPTPMLAALRQAQGFLQEQEAPDEHEPTGMADTHAQGCAADCGEEIVATSQTTEKQGELNRDTS